MLQQLRLTCAAAAAFLLTACSTYDFAAARAADGGYDVAKLIADLEAAPARASGEPERLTQGTWIPLLWFDFTSFRRSEAPDPAGYTLEHLAAAGPVFCIGGGQKTLYDQDGKVIEKDRDGWLLWGCLWRDQDSSVATVAGPRFARSYRFLLLGGDDSVVYGGEAAN
ncbi:MAG: hypothetical protein K8J09_10690 [Planctomycetes bacterium]|nr:hypothetical protein [Planctomycetota bacterium]MCC7396506.1 hypothetical protein [Planctomycetota bacterium]